MRSSTQDRISVPDTKKYKKVVVLLVLKLVTYASLFQVDDDIRVCNRGSRQEVGYHGKCISAGSSVKDCNFRALGKFPEKKEYGESTS